MITLNRKLSKNDSKWAANCLTNVGRVAERLVLWTLDQIELLINYELQTRKRMGVLQRLVARYSRCEAKQNEALVMREAGRR